MYAVLAVILLAVAGFTVLVLRRSRGDASSARSQLESFGYLGAGALALVAAATVIIGLSGLPGGTAELVAMVGFFAFVLYLGIAYVVATVLTRRS
ncbi:hypothetical protein [Microlunatus ginsengisoli]|uniref:Integral membrane protein n=1 Tax=Microlunatus ginsengisoli TaxID=363863 RepID=A0ABP6ZGZ3_9ACTN